MKLHQIVLLAVLEAYLFLPLADNSHVLHFFLVAINVSTKFHSVYTYILLLWYLSSILQKEISVILIVGRCTTFYSICVDRNATQPFNSFGVLVNVTK